MEKLGLKRIRIICITGFMYALAGLITGFTAVPVSGSDLSIAKNSRANYVHTYQPINDYNISLNEIKLDDGRIDPNPARFYTRIGTNYGKMGTVKRHMKWLPTGQIQAEIFGDQWSGVWHSLHGLTKQRLPGLYFSAAYPSLILPEYQPKVIGAYINVKGKGRLKLEIKARDAKGNEIRKPYSLAKEVVASPYRFQTLVWPNFAKKVDCLMEFKNLKEALSSNRIKWDYSAVDHFPAISIFSWVTEGKGSRLIIDEIGLLLAFPELPRHLHNQAMASAL